MVGAYHTAAYMYTVGVFAAVRFTDGCWTADDISLRATGRGYAMSLDGEQHT